MTKLHSGQFQKVYSEKLMNKKNIVEISPEYFQGI